MTKVRFFKNNNVLTGFEIKGHAGAGCAGNDIVCAAISSAAQMTANTITEIIGVPAQVKQQEGLLLVSLSAENAKKCRHVIEGLKLHLTELQRQYPHNITIIDGGVLNAKY
ncbi:MAG: ribosomal-processing cysteine protease Prp [Oscillospiraceae bacterium]|jgi:uncharacterized protein YsxB (DUF464 family)|nr:ribosomal-processing cysteine protease Prp [Oscillospiraceae bacterium]